ncbi:MAG: phosphoribosylformylglycinamidine cyclo-ligase [Armatimonadota bacterium]|nr:phosphoribosylformylglycinamidine cyclo-ligase [Armatimonadota bacterium]
MARRRGRTQNKRPGPITYRDAGVDIDQANATLEQLKPLIRATFTSNVAADVGTFGAMFSLGEWAGRDSLLVTSVDSVGTKLMVARMMNQYNTVGHDLVNHCVNDILVQGARPLFFMDYIAADNLAAELVRELIEGLSAACKEVGCALIGGEMAELPGIYREREYDLVGFIAGVVERDRAIRGDSIQPGDVLIGLASNGLHTNGYSLARKLFFEIAGLPVDQFVPELNRTIGEELMRIHRCYAPAVLPLLEDLEVRGMAHITGGGLPDNLVRCLPEGCRAVIERGSWHVPAIFELIQDLGRVPDEDMYHTFNMGLGFVLVVPEPIADEAASRLSAAGETGYRIGRIEPGDRGVNIV